MSFVPGARMRIAVSGDGTLAAITEPTRITIVDLPSCAVVAEVGIDLAASTTEVVWVGPPLRLLVLARYDEHSSAHLLDPNGPRTIAEIRLESPMRMFAAVGSYALAVGSHAAILTAGEAHLTPYQFPSRVIPVAAGAAASQFVVALPGSVEEWDPVSRMPKRRLRLPRPAVISAVGGSDRVVWITTQQNPARLDVMPLVNRGQPKTHELPEAIAASSGHPRSDLVVCVGADSGRLYAVDLDGRTRLRTIAADGIDRPDAAGLVIGRSVGVVVAQVDRALAFVALDSREVEPAAAPIPRHREEPPPRRALEVTVENEEDDGPMWPTSAPIAAFAPPPSPAEPGPTPAPRPPAAAWSTVSENVTPRPLKRPADGEALPPRPTWRDDVVIWARAIMAGTFDRATPPAPPIELVAARFELPPRLVPALVLLYGAHLAGEHGCAPVDLSRVLGRRWDDALGRGELAASGIVIHERSRVYLRPTIVDVLDDQPPVTGTLVGEPSAMTLLGPCTVVASDDSLIAIAERFLLSAGGAILAAHHAADPVDLVLEARARGAAPMLHFDAGRKLRASDAVILVVASEQIAEQLGIPRLS